MDNLPALHRGEVVRSTSDLGRTEDNDKARQFWEAIMRISDEDLRKRLETAARTIFDPSVYPFPIPILLLQLLLMKMVIY